MDTSTEEKTTEDISLTNTLPAITGVVRSRSESSINDDDNDSDFSFDDFKYMDDSDNDDVVDDLDRRSRRTNQRRLQRLALSEEKKEAERISNTIAHQIRRAFETP